MFPLAVFLIAHQQVLGRLGCFVDAATVPRQKLPRLQLGSVSLREQLLHMRRKLKQEVRLSDLSEAAEIRFPRRETPMTFVQDKEKKKKIC